MGLGVRPVGLGVRPVGLAPLLARGRLRQRLRRHLRQRLRRHLRLRPSLHLRLRPSLRLRLRLHLRLRCHPGHRGHRGHRGHDRRTRGRREGGLVEGPKREPVLAVEESDGLGRRRGRRKGDDGLALAAQLHVDDVLAAPVLEERLDPPGLAPRIQPAHEHLGHAARLLLLLLLLLLLPPWLLRPRRRRPGCDALARARRRLHGRQSLCAARAGCGQGLLLLLLLLLLRAASEGRSRNEAAVRGARLLRAIGHGGGRAERRVAERGPPVGGRRIASRAVSENVAALARDALGGPVEGLGGAGGTGRQHAQQAVLDVPVIGPVGKPQAVDVPDDQQEAARELDAGGLDHAALGVQRHGEELPHVLLLEAEDLRVVPRRVPRQLGPSQLQYHVHQRPHVVPPRELLVHVRVHRGVAASAAELGRLARLAHLAILQPPSPGLRAGDGIGEQEGRRAGGQEGRRAAEGGELRVRARVRARCEHLDGRAPQQGAEAGEERVRAGQQGKAGKGRRRRTLLRATSGRRDAKKRRGARTTTVRRARAPAQSRGGSKCSRPAARCSNSTA